MAKQTKAKQTKAVRKFGLASQILSAIRRDAKGSGISRASDYYAKQANPKDGGYAKSNYIKGDDRPFVRPEERKEVLVSIQAKASRIAKASQIAKGTRTKGSR